MSEREQARRRRFCVFMAEYYAARQADLLALEAATALYAAERIKEQRDQQERAS